MSTDRERVCGRFWKQSGTESTRADRPCDKVDHRFLAVGNLRLVLLYLGLDAF